METLKRNLPWGIVVIAGLAVAYFVLRRPSETVEYQGSDGGEEAFRIVTLLPRDAIPAIDNPVFYNASEADLEYDPEELVLGVSIDGEHRAYSTSLLNGHEIVNDTIAGRPISVTW